MQYLVTYIQDGKRESFFTEWFDVDSHYIENSDMIVFDLGNREFLDEDLVWRDIDEDHF